MPRSESPNRGSTRTALAFRVMLLVVSPSFVACAGSAKELALVREELVKIHKDHDALAKRIEELESRDPHASDPAPVVVAEPPAATEGKPLKVVKLEPATASASQPAPAAVDPIDDDEPRPLLKIGPSGAIEQTMPDEPSPKKKPAPAKNPVLDPQAAKDYDAAYALVKAKKLSQALDAFGVFIVRYPDHPYAANALYWRGECYYALGEYGSAVGQYDALIIRYPASAKMPDTLLKLGLSHRKLGSTAKAKAAFDRLRKDYPTSDAVKKIPPEDAT